MRGYSQDENFIYLKKGNKSSHRIEAQNEFRQLQWLRWQTDKANNSKDLEEITFFINGGIGYFLAARETELCCQVELHCRTVFRGQILTNNAFRQTTDTVSRAT